MAVFLGGGNKGQQTLDGLQSPDCDTQLCTLGTLCEVRSTYLVVCSCFTF